MLKKERTELSKEELLDLVSGFYESADIFQSGCNNDSFVALALIARLVADAPKDYEPYNYYLLDNIANKSNTINIGQALYDSLYPGIRTDIIKWQEKHGENADEKLLSCLAWARDLRAVTYIDVWWKSHSEKIIFNS
jgi:hypothetical protein